MPEISNQQAVNLMPMASGQQFQQPRQQSNSFGYSVAGPSQGIPMSMQQQQPIMFSQQQQQKQKQKQVFIQSPQQQQQHMYNQQQSHYVRQVNLTVQPQGSLRC